MGAALKKARSRTGDSGPSTLQLMEESFHQLRGTPVSTWLVYAAGALPWVFLALYFWARTTWFVPEGPEIAVEAFVLTAAFVGLKVAQARFCQCLAAARVGEKVRPYSAKDYVALGLRQLRLQAWGLALLPLAFIASIPFASAFAYFQNLSVLSDEPSARSDAFKEAMRWPKQNWAGIGLLFLFALLVWFNIATAFYILPWAANHLLGIHNLFAVDGWFAVNPTFLVSVSFLTWLVTDPFIKSFYVLRLFYGRAQRTGADILIAFRAPRLVAGAAWVAIAWFAVCGASRSLAAPPQAPTTQSAASIQAKQLDEAIDTALQSPEFRWRLRPKPTLSKVEEDGVVRRFLRDTIKLIESVVHDIADWVDRIRHWFDSDKPTDEPASAKSGGDYSGAVKVFLVVLIGIAATLLVFLIVTSLRRGATRRIQSAASEIPGEAQPDLRDENVQAAQLPTEGWLQLAQREMTKGEWRWALRALYLATLAQLGSQGLITLAKFKTNTEYERELRRRAPSQGSVLSRFGRRRLEFEQVWYGQAVADEARVREWLEDFGGASR